MLGPIRSLLYVPGTHPDRFQKAMQAGEGVTTMDGGMIERPIVERARRTLAQAATFGNR